MIGLAVRAGPEAAEQTTHDPVLVISLHPRIRFGVGRMVQDNTEPTLLRGDPDLMGTVEAGRQGGDGRKIGVTDEKRSQAQYRSTATDQAASNSLAGHVPMLMRQAGKRK